MNLADQETSFIPAFVVDRFVAEWESTGRPPDFDAYLPDAAVIRRTALIELIRIDLRHRWTAARHPKLLREYCDQYPELHVDRLPVDLIYDEFVLRRQSGETVDPRSYLRDYPAQASWLEQLLNTGSEPTTIADSTVITSPRRDALEQLEVGQRLDEFDLLTGLGSGAFARVFLARQRSMQRLVAVKISEDHGSEPQTLAQLDHDYIVRVFDQRRLPENGLKVLYMQYVSGGTLLSVLQRVRATAPDRRTSQLLLDVVDETLAERGELRPADSSARDEIAKLSWPETIAWLGRRLADALDYAGKQGVLHRDIKPANILLTADGVPKLADFNISFSGKIPGNSPVAYFGGSLSYMSPEQLEACHPGKDTTAATLDTRSDMYSLGVVLWELLTGRKPFPDKGTSTGAGDQTTLDAMLEHRHRGITQEALAGLPPDTPAALRRVLLDCLHPDRNQRWATGAELAQQFDLCLDPHARDLVDPPPGSWRLRLRPWSILIMELGVVVPNLLATYLNYYIIKTLVIDTLGADDRHRFDLMWLTVVAVSFPLGALLVLYLRRYLVLVPHGLRKGKTYSAQVLARARTDALLLGDRIVVVIFGIWIVCGIAWAVAIRIGIGEISVRGYVQFFASVIVCAAVSVAYPFFLVAFYAVRCLYPTFLPHGAVSGHDSIRMVGLRRRSVRYLAVAAAVPLVGVGIATFIPPGEISTIVGAIRALCLGGIAAFIGAYWLFRKLEEDLLALERVTSTESEPIMAL